MNYLNHTQIKKIDVLKLFWNRICYIFVKIDFMKEFIYLLFGQPIPKSKGVIGTKSGKLVLDKKVFYKRKDVRATIDGMKKAYRPL